MKTKALFGSCLAGILVFRPAAGLAGSNNPSTDWMHEGKLGVFMHCLARDEKMFAQLQAFDAEHLARQLDFAGAKWFCITLGQNAGYYLAPNAAYDRITGYRPGERCLTRDLPMDLHLALAPHGIRLMLYLPCQAPLNDKQALAGFAQLRRAENKREPMTIEFARQWAKVIQEWSDRYGDKVSGWWFDGGYKYVGFNSKIARLYAEAARHGNPNAVVALNPGVGLIRYQEVEDYTAGEIPDDPFRHIPQSRWLDGSQWHLLTYLGPETNRWATRFSVEQWCGWAKKVAAGGGTITLDTRPNWDPPSAPVGAMPSEHVNQIKMMMQSMTTGSQP